MAIKETEVEVNLGLQTDKHYESLGYVIPRYPNGHGKMCVKLGATLFVKVSDLQLTSRVRVTKLCDYCHSDVPNQKYADVINRRVLGKDVCRKCAHTKAGVTRMLNKPIEERLSRTHPELCLEWVRCVGRSDITPDSTTSGSGFYVLWKCRKEECGHEWGATIYNRAIHGTGCPACAGTIVSDNNRLSLLYPKIASELHLTKNEFRADEIAVAARKNAWWVCAECKNEWSAPLYSRTLAGNGCPACSESRGERFVRKHLLENRTPFISQASTNGLKGSGGGPLYFDFVITDEGGDWRAVIEYDGEQHTRNCGDFFGGQYGFERTQEHDRRKNEWCRVNSIPILRIKHDVLFEDIPVMIDDFISTSSSKHNI